MHLEATTDIYFSTVNPILTQQLKPTDNPMIPLVLRPILDIMHLILGKSVNPFVNKSQLITVCDPRLHFGI